MLNILADFLIVLMGKPPWVMGTGTVQDTHGFTHAIAYGQPP